MKTDALFFPEVSLDVAGVRVFPEPFVFYLATFIVAGLAGRSFVRARLPIGRKDFLVLAALSIGLMLVGTRLWYFVIFDSGPRFGSPLGRLLDPTGLASVGLYLGFFAGVLLWGRLWLRKRRSDYRALTSTTLDHICCFLPLGTFVGRIGCFLDAHKLGTPSDLPWALIRSEVPPLNVPRHPLGLYQALAALLLFAVLHVLRKRRGAPEHLEFWYVVLFAASHFLLDFVSAEALLRPWLGLTADQLVCLAVIVLRVAIRVRRPLGAALRVAKAAG